MERALKTVVDNGLRAGWMSLGHDDSEVLRLLGQLPGQPLALRAADGSDNSLSSSSLATDELPMGLGLDVGHVDVPEVSSGPAGSSAAAETTAHGP